jgi:hypothetical protein
MECKQISARVELSSYANKILAIVKAKYGLKDKSEAINKFMGIYSEEVVEKEANEKYVGRILEVANKHFAKYKNRRMSIKELDALCET